jgi:hypothetical protein
VTGRIAAALCLVALGAGCGGYSGADTGAAPPSGPPGYAGTVEDVSAGGTVLVKAEGDACGIWVSPAEEVHVFRRSGSSFEEAAWADLVPGSQVELWIPGPIAESCPMQGEAEAAVVVAAAP